VCKAKVEAMLNEAGINWANARILFCHNNQVFGRSLFVSAHKRRIFFLE
jgi:hypothetical protein